MTENQNSINQLVDKLNAISKRQEDFSQEIDILRAQINRLRISEIRETAKREEVEVTSPVADGAINTIELEGEGEKRDSNYIASQPPKIEVSIEEPIEISRDIEYSEPPELPNSKMESTPTPSKVKLDIEKFIGENLINKIGIIITIIGVAIGAKYSIDNDLISPLTRVILGYLAGVGLLGIGMKLKRKYESYSAVLVSGAIAIFYFITYAAYSFYELIPQLFTFALMVLFTAFAVVAAINYNRQVIAHIGLVGAYAVPFLLSEGSGEVTVLFSYIAIINIGILIISLKRYWKSLYFSSFGFTWIIYSVWYSEKFYVDDNFSTALIYLSIFFIIFYLISIAYKLIRESRFKIEDTILLLLNSAIFYGIGYTTLSQHEDGVLLLGLFTLSNAIIHFIVSLVINKQKVADKNLLYLISGLVLIFITVTIPVQLDGNWVTLLWIGEALLLFWIGRSKSIPIYEYISYPLMVLALLSIVQDWSIVYSSYTPEYPELRVTPLLNINFITSVIAILAFYFINRVNSNKSYNSLPVEKNGLSKIISFATPTVTLLLIYYGFRMEIESYWSQLYLDSEIIINSDGQEYSSNYMNSDLLEFKRVWCINYSLLFVSILSLINFIKFKSRSLGLVNIGLNILAIIVFLTQGLYVLSELRDSYLDQTLSEYYQVGLFNIGIRYISIALSMITTVLTYKYVRKEFIRYNFKVAFDLILHISILWILSSELIQWMQIAESTQSYKLGLTILWGVYSLTLISLGIWRKKKHLRIGAISLFGALLIKLFVYDISDLNSIAKIIVFVSLGALLLIISFLYNKYKHSISDENRN